MQILIAARQSDLARLQAYQVGEALKKQGQDVRYHFRESLGDINQDDPLWQMPEKGVFTEDFREGLEKGLWDMVVHSWKDLPIETWKSTEICATLPRADARDILLFKKEHFEKVKKTAKLRVFSSSPRRIYNLTPFFKDSMPFDLKEVEFESVRGNILTRVSKMMEQETIDALIVAKAALDRLLSVQGQEFEDGQEQLRTFLSQCFFQVLPLSQNPTAAAQGALAVEVRKDREDLKSLLQSIHCEDTWINARREREVLKAHGGGCHQKIGVSCFQQQGGPRVQFLRGETEVGETLNSLDISMDLPRPQKPFVDSLEVFKREAKSFTKDPQFTGHFISRSPAVPGGVSFSQDEVLWASGFETWKKLAKRGYWISGCSDSLGEEDVRSLGPLFSGRRWYKWAHDGAPVSADKKLLATYTLKAQTLSHELSGYKEFYWMSGTQFEEALNQFPDILEAVHYCGVGHTYTKIKDVLNQKKSQQARVVALPSRKLWLELIKEFKS
jgi:hydroxymethylbilane synthase